MPTALSIAQSQLSRTDPAPYWDAIWPNHPSDATEWCAIFVSYCFDAAGTPLPKMDETAVTSGFAYCPDAEAWAKANGAWTTTPAAGDVVLFCWDGSGTAEHTGIVEAVNADGSITTIEGNTGSPAGVYEHTRSGSEILGYVRPSTTPEAAPSTPTVDATNAEIIDVASFQHPSGASIDWTAVAGAGIKGVIVKVTEGTGYVNPYAAGDISGAKAAGLVVAGYLFLHPSEDPVAQADYYLANGGAQLAGVALDCEATDGDTWSQVDTAMQECHDHLALVGGKTVLAYLDKSWYEDTGISRWGWYIWLADPSDSSPAYPCELWQYGTSTVNGIQGSVDRDRWVGSQSIFDQFFGVGSTPTPEPTPSPSPTPTPTPTPGDDVQLPEVAEGSPLVYWTKTIQAICREKMGQPTLAVDGAFGPLTKQAVENVQTFFGLSVDGIVGPQTWPVLLGL